MKIHACTIVKPTENETSDCEAFVFFSLLSSELNEFLKRVAFLNE